MSVTARHRPQWPEGVGLLLGLGAQKAGSSWLHHTLCRHPGIHAFPMKELHYFDTLAGGRLGPAMVSRRLNAMRLRDAGPRRLARVGMLAEAMARPGGDDALYVEALTRGARPGTVVLDVTPAYATLDQGWFARMAAIGPARFLYVLREPVARFWSGIRMEVARRGGADDSFEAAARAAVDRALAGEDLGGSFLRTDYAGSLARLAAAVPAERRLVLFFETLFTQSSLDRVLAFTGLAPMALTDTAPRNPGRAATLRPDQVERLTERFRPQYEAVCAAFCDAVPEAWHRRFAAGAVAA